MASTIINSLTAQVVRSSDMTARFDAYLKEVGGPRMLEIASECCIDLLLNLTPGDWKCTMIIDGIDQISSNEAEALFGQLARLSKFRRVRLCCSSHPTWDSLRKAQNILFHASEVKIAYMNGIDRSQEAHDFVVTEIAKWEARGLRFPSPVFKLRIINALKGHWDNMFLWLKLQMELIEEDLQDGNGCDIDYLLARIHDDLSALYERRLSEVAKRNARLGRIIFQLVVGADPALKVHELRIAANIQPGNNDWSPGPLPRSASVLCSHYGGKLLEVDDTSDEIRIIHGSVAIHLCKTFQNEVTAPLHFTLREARDLVGVVCITYLNLPSLEQSLTIKRRSAHGSDCHASQGMGMVAQHAMDDSRLDRHWLAPVFRGKQERLNSDLDPWAFLGDLVARHTADYVLTDFLSYAKVNLFSATRSLNLTSDQQMIWNKIIRGKTPYGLLRKLLQDPSTGILWAIDDGHRPLFSHHVVDQQTSNVQLDRARRQRLIGLLLSQWDDFTYGGPLFVFLADWLYKNRPPVFSSYWKKVVKLAYIRRPVSGTMNVLTPKETAILGNMAWGTFELLMRSRVSHEEFSTMLHLLRDYIQDQIRCQPLSSKDEIVGKTQARGTFFLPIAFAVSQEFDVVERIAALVSAGANPNDMSNNEENIPLFMAVDKGNVAITQALLHHGADVDVSFSQESGQTNPLIMAVQKQDLKVTKCLLTYQAKFQKDRNGDTALHIAVRDEELGVLRLKCLLRDGSYDDDVLNARNECGRTALFEALHRRHAQSAVVLIRFGARRLLEGAGFACDVVATNGSLREDPLNCLLEQCSIIETCEREYIIDPTTPTDPIDPTRTVGSTDPIRFMWQKGAIVRVLLKDT